MTIADSGDCGMTIRSGTSNSGQIYFSDGTSGSAEYDGAIEYSQANETMKLYTSGEERIIIGSGGDFSVKATEGTSANLYLIADQGDNNGDGWRVGSNQDDNDLTFANNTSGSYVDKLTLLNSGNATFAGTVSDSIGDLRKIPNNATTSAHTLGSSDVGKVVTNTSGGVTIPNGVFAGGSAVTIINHSGSDITITQGSGLTLYNTADASTGNRTLAGRGMCSVWFQASSAAYISGAGLS